MNVKLTPKVSTCHKPNQTNNFPSNCLQKLNEALIGLNMGLSSVKSMCPTQERIKY